MKTLVLFLVLLCGAGAQYYPGEITSAQPFTGSARTSALTTSSVSYAMSFSCGLIINTETGEVTIPKDMKMDEAAREFWKQIEMAYPYAFPKDRVKKTEPLEINWGPQFVLFVKGKTIELGLRSDGVLVWREIK